MRDIRLGDDIDDFCVRCKRVMNHAVVSVIGGAAAKVRCRTCHSDHDFRNEQPPPPKVDLRKQALFNEVLKKVDPQDPAAAAAADDLVEVAADLALDPDSESELDAAVVGEEDAVEEEAAAISEAEIGVAAGEQEEEAPPVKVAAKTKAKSKARK